MRVYGPQARRLVNVPGFGATMAPAPQMRLVPMPGNFPGTRVPAQPYPAALARQDMIASLGETPAARIKPDRGAVTSFVEVINQASEVVKVVNIIAKRSPGS